MYHYCMSPDRHIHITCIYINFSSSHQYVELAEHLKLGEILKVAECLKVTEGLKVTKGSKVAVGLKFAEMTALQYLL